MRNRAVNQWFETNKSSVAYVPGSIMDNTNARGQDQIAVWTQIQTTTLTFAFADTLFRFSSRKPQKQ